MCLTFRYAVSTLSSRMNRSLSYQDVYLIPQFSPVHSRSQINTSVRFGPYNFRLPVVPANMECTIDHRLAGALSDDDYFYIMHRFTAKSGWVDGEGEKLKNTDDFLRSPHTRERRFVSISIGVQEEDQRRVWGWNEDGLRIDYLTVDIAHAHSTRARDMLVYLNQLNWKHRPFIIVGNVATPDAVMSLESWGADAVKVGIAQGGACTTYGKTGFGIPMFTCVLECAKVATKPIIADGGIKTNGDIAKAIAAGATMVMAGSLFAACIDSPAEPIYGNATTRVTDLGVYEARGAITHKRYFGSASSASKGKNAGHIEGTTVLLPVDPHTYAEKLVELTEDLQSACSYAGGSLERLSQCPWGVR